MVTRDDDTNAAANRGQKLTLRGLPLAEKPAAYGWKTTNERGYTINEAPSGTGRKLRVIGVGAGASGINLAKAVRDDLTDVNVVLYDKNPDVGGTWWENRYPGIRCDIPSVVYQYTWNPSIWSEYYASGGEILQYFKDTVKQFDLMKHIKLRHLVTRAEWQENDGKWRLSITDLSTGKEFEDECDIFVNAMGFLNDWQWPRIAGLDTFKGVLAHSASYPEGLKLKDKRVAVVGNGSSGLQLVPAVQPEVSHLFTWIRSPTWMTAGFAQKYAGPNGQNFKYSKRQKDLLKNSPEYYLRYQKAVETEMVAGFALFHRNGPESQAAYNFASNDMKTRLHGRDELIDTLIPKTFPVGCKRPTSVFVSCDTSGTANIVCSPGNGYLEAITRPNVTVFRNGGLEQITPTGFVDPDGKEHVVDAIILATGFNTSWVPRFPIIANGINLQDLYRKRPIGYLGVAAPQMPNFFTVYGPYGPLASGSAMPMITSFVNYIVQMARHIQTQDILSVTPRQEVIDQYAEHADLFNDRTVWKAPCRSWFKNNQIDGRILLHPGSRNQYLELMAHPRLQDYDHVYRSKNMWSWLGNGFSLRDYDGRDRTWYFGMVDGEDKQKEYDVHELEYRAAASL